MRDAKCASALDAARRRVDVVARRGEEPREAQAREARAAARGALGRRARRRARERDESDDGEDDVVARAGAFGRYGAADGAMSRADDEWATSERAWASLFGVLERNGYAKKKLWAPFVYDGEAGRRMRRAGFERVVHRRADFFERVRDAVFVRSLDAVVDNPPYTGKGMKERILRALRDAEVPFCLLLPLGVLHAAFVREILEEEHVQVIVPRKCYVFKKGGTEVPFKFLCWLCYKMELKRDLYFID